jgi:two-component system LytT family response regulator
MKKLPIAPPSPLVTPDAPFVTDGVNTDEGPHTVTGMKPPLHALIVDDEKLCRLDLRSYVARLPGIGEIREAGTVAAAKAAMPGIAVVFLDVQLTRGTGFDVVAELPVEARPELIFTTAHRDYAVTAFALNAADYLLKPVEESRVIEAWNRARARFTSRHIPTEARFPVELPTGVEWWPAVHLIAVTSEGNYVKLHRMARPPVLLRDTFTRWMEAFPADCLVEIGRGRAVNRRSVMAIEGARDERIVVMADGSRYPISRRLATQAEVELRTR